jgi:hypothetical protein
VSEGLEGFIPEAVLFEVGASVPLDGGGELDALWVSDGWSLTPLLGWGRQTQAGKASGRGIGLLASRLDVVGCPVVRPMPHRLVEGACFEGPDPGLC